MNSPPRQRPRSLQAATNRVRACFTCTFGGSCRTRVRGGYAAPARMCFAHLHTWDALLRLIHRLITIYFQTEFHADRTFLCFAWNSGRELFHADCTFPVLHGTPDGNCSMQIALSHFCMELWTLYVFPAYTQGKRLDVKISLAPSKGMPSCWPVIDCMQTSTSLSV